MPKVRVSIFQRETNFETYAAGDVIFSAGDPGDCMYAVKRGQVEIRVGDRVVETMEKGEIFGEMALLDDAPRSATAVAAEECDIVPVDKERFTSLVQQTPLFALQVMQAMAERLRKANAAN